MTGAIQRASGVTRLIIGPATGYSGPYTWCQAKAFAENRSLSGFAHGSAEKNIANQAVSDVFHGLNFQNWILRLGEIMLGVVLIGVGVAKLTGTDNFIMKAATKAGKAALL
jgi:hypothetical protein